MKTKFSPVRHATALLLFAILNIHPSTLQAQGTAFTYQGRRNEKGSPAHGSYDAICSLPRRERG